MQSHYKVKEHKKEVIEEQKSASEHRKVYIVKEKVEETKTSAEMIQQV